MIHFVTYLILCILQPICLPVPETATVLWGSVKLGALCAFMIGVIGTTIGIMLMYRMAAYGTGKFIQKLKSSDKLLQYRSYVQKHEVLITGLLFIIPVLPDEIICVGAAVIGISYSRFITIAVLSKGCSVAMIAYSSEIAQYCHIGRTDVICLEILFLLCGAFIMKLVNRSKGENGEAKGDCGTM